MHVSFYSSSYVTKFTFIEKQESLVCRSAACELTIAWSCDYAFLSQGKSVLSSHACRCDIQTDTTSDLDDDMRD